MRSGLAWKNLINNICPQCDYPFHRNDNDDYRCDRCGLFIRYYKAREIIDSIIHRESVNNLEKEADKILKNND